MEIKCTINIICFNSFETIIHPILHGMERLSSTKSVPDVKQRLGTAELDHYIGHLIIFMCAVRK